MRQKIPRISIPGLDKFNAAWAAMCDAVETALNIEGSGDLTVIPTSGGFQILNQIKGPIDIVLTSAAGGSGSYNFSRVYAATGGGWTTYPSPLTGVAWEYNRTPGLLGVVSPFYTKAKWFNTSTGGEFRFQAGVCGTTSASAAFPAWVSRPAGLATVGSTPPVADISHRPFPF